MGGKTKTDVSQVQRSHQKDIGEGSVTVGGHSLIADQQRIPGMSVEQETSAWNPKGGVPEHGESRPPALRQGLGFPVEPPRARAPTPAADLGPHVSPPSHTAAPVGLRETDGLPGQPTARPAQWAHPVCTQRVPQPEAQPP